MTFAENIAKTDLTLGELMKAHEHAGLLNWGNLLAEPIERYPNFSKTRIESALFASTSILNTLEA